MGRIMSHIKNLSKKLWIYKRLPITNIVVLLWEKSWVYKRLLITNIVISKKNKFLSRAHMYAIG